MRRVFGKANTNAFADVAGFASATKQVLRPGKPLDGAAPGSGFGWSIVSELAELYGGNIALAEAPLGGTACDIGAPQRPPPA